MSQKSAFLRKGAVRDGINSIKPELSVASPRRSSIDNTLKNVPLVTLSYLHSLRSVCLYGIINILCKMINRESGTWGHVCDIDARGMYAWAFVGLFVMQELCREICGFLWQISKKTHHIDMSSVTRLWQNFFADHDPTIQNNRNRDRMISLPMLYHCDMNFQIFLKVIFLEQFFNGLEIFL